MKEKASKEARFSSPFYTVWTALGMALLVFFLYHSALMGWWRWDDTLHLKQAISQTPREYFLSPEAYQVLSLKNFTPWLIFSFDMDLNFLGLDPTRFYARQLLDLWLAGFVSYFLLRFWVSPTWAALGGALCMVGAPVATTVQQLMTRHYLEGLIFALLSLYLFLISFREKRGFTAFWGALLYFLAMVSKEVFVPLSLVCMLWPKGSFKKRFFLSSPYFLALFLYILWREYMIGMLGGGYRIEWGAVLLLPIKFYQAFFGDSYFSLVVSLMAAAALLLFLFKKAPNLMLGRFLFAAALIAAVAGPLIPLGPDAGAGRYFLVPWWVFSMVFAVFLGANQTHNRRTRIFSLTMFCLVVLTTLVHGHVGKLSMDSVIERFDAQGRFLWESQKPRTVLYAPVTSHFGHYFSGLHWIKGHAMGVSQTFNIMGDEIQLAGLEGQPENVWAYDAESRAVEDISKKIPTILKSWKKNQRLMPLSFRLQYGKDKTAIWKCGPYASGTYTLLSWDDTSKDGFRKPTIMNKFPLSPSGQWRVNLENPFYFYLRYDSPTGWTTYSPVLYFDPRDGHFQWRRENARKTSDETKKSVE